MVPTKGKVFMVLILTVRLLSSVTLSEHTHTHREKARELLLILAVGQHQLSVFVSFH